MMINMSTSSFNDGVKSAKNADHLSSWAPLRWVHCSKQCFCKYIHLCMGCVSAKIASWPWHPRRSNCTKILMKWSVLMLSHTLIDSTVFMRDETKPHTARICQDVLASAIKSPVVSQESRYLYHCELVVDCVQKHNWYESRTLNCCWASRTSARWMAKHHTCMHTTINGQHQSWTSRHCWGIQVNMLIINKQLKGILELSLFVCEICLAFIFFLWTDPCLKKTHWNVILSNICPLKSIYKNLIIFFASNILGRWLPTIAKQNYQYLVTFIAVR